MRRLPFTVGLFVRLGLYALAVIALASISEPEGWVEWVALVALTALALLMGGIVLTSQWVESGWRPLAEKSTVNLTIAADYAREMSAITTATLSELAKYDPQAAAIIGQRAFDVGSRFQEMT